MAAALLAAMRSQHGEFDPIASFKHTSVVAPSFSFRARRTDRNDPEFREAVSPSPGAHEYRVTHDHVDLIKISAPKYSMRERTSSPMHRDIPAPGVYDIPPTVGKAHPSVSTGPQWHFGNLERDRAHGRVLQYMPETPSPQDYQVTTERAFGRVDQSAAPAWTFTGRRVDRRDAEFREAADPRPGAHEYDVTHEHVDLTKGKAPEFSMRARTPSPSRERTPAPDLYYIPPIFGGAHPSVSKGPQWQFGIADRDRASGGVLAFMPQTPSPQEYHITDDRVIGRPDQPAAPAWTFPGRRVDRTDVEFREAADPRPGAHEYDVTHEHLDLTKTKAPTYSMRAKHASRSRSSSPAPGAYDTPSAVGSDHPAIQNGPRYGFGSSHRDNVVGRMLAYMPETPSPQEYRVVGEKAIGRVNQKAAPSWSMGTQQLDRNDPEYKETRNPTPNAQTYNITHDHVDLTKGSAPKYSMRPRSLSRKSRSVSPGPGSYDIRRSLSRGSSPQSSSRSARRPCGFGSAQRFQDKKPDNRIYSY